MAAVVAAGVVTDNDVPIRLAAVPLSANARLVKVSDSGYGAANNRFYRLTAPAQPGS